MDEAAVVLVALAGLFVGATWPGTLGALGLAYACVASLYVCSLSE